MKFKVIREQNLCDLEFFVNQFIENGWILQGNLIIDETSFTQVMIRI